MKNPVTFVSVMVVWGVAACGGPSGRIKEPGEASLVGDRRADAVTYRRLIDGALKELSRKFREQSRFSNAPKIRISFVGVDNKTTEELGAWRDQINEIVNAAINESGDFADISFEHFVQPAMDAAGVTYKNLVIPQEVRKVLAVLEKNNQILDALLFAKLTEGVTTQGNLKQSDYILTMELMNPIDGSRTISKAELSKEYTR